jgi:hypothetical protein
MDARDTTTKKSPADTPLAKHHRAGRPKIRCPTLVCEAEKDLFFRGQAQLLFDHLTCPKTMLKFTDAEVPAPTATSARAALGSVVCMTGLMRRSLRSVRVGYF